MEIKIERLIDSLKKAGFTRLEGERKIEALAELPRLMTDSNSDVFYNEFVESGYAYGYVVAIHSICIGCWEVYVVVIHRGWSPERDYEFVDAEVWYKAFGFDV